MVVNHKSQVSVCIITYNHEAFIQKAIESILIQDTTFEFEIIISNDASKDGTHDIIVNIINSHPKGKNIKYFNQEVNLGMMNNLFFALKQCTGKYIAFCEGDDFWIDTKKLQKQYDFLESNHAYSFCGHQSKQLIDDTYYDLQIPVGEYKFGDIVKKNRITTASLVFRSESIIALDSINQNFHAADWIMQFLALKVGNAYVLNDVMSVYRKHENGIWSKNSLKQMGLLGIKVLKQAKRIYKGDRLKIKMIDDAILVRKKEYGLNKGLVHRLMEKFSF